MEQERIWQLVQRTNKEWYEGNPKNLRDFFHRGVTFNSLDFQHQITEKENCIQTYVDFLSTSKIEPYSESSPKVQVVDNTAMTTYSFETRHLQKEKEYHETGTDILVFKQF